MISDSGPNLELKQSDKPASIGRFILWVFKTDLDIKRSGRFCQNDLGSFQFRAEVTKKD